MDLSKAFDLVSHDVLRSKLAKYHVSPEALECSLRISATAHNDATSQGHCPAF